MAVFTNLIAELTFLMEQINQVLTLLQVSKLDEVCLVVVQNLDMHVIQLFSKLKLLHLTRETLYRELNCCAFSI